MGGDSHIVTLSALVQGTLWMWLCTNCILLDIVHSTIPLDPEENRPRTARSRFVRILTKKSDERQNSMGELGTLKEHDWAQIPYLACYESLVKLRLRVCMTAFIGKKT